MPDDIGIHDAAMTNDEYRALDGITSTELRRFLKAPILMDHNPVQKASDARTLGLMAHMVFAGDERLDEIYQKSFYTDGRFKEAKEEKRKALERGIDLLRPALYDAAMDAGNAAMDLFNAWLHDIGTHECVVFEEPMVAIHKPSGLVIKSRPDAAVYTDDGVWIVDLKTTSDATPRGFSRQARSNGYITQLAHYAEVMVAHNDAPILGAVIVAVETNAPHAGAVHNIDSEALTMERLDCEEAYSRIHAARTSGVYPNIQPGTLYGDSDAVKAKHPDALMRRALHLVKSGLSIGKAAKLCHIARHKVAYQLKRNPLNI